MESNHVVRTGVFGLLWLAAAAAGSAGAAYLLRYSVIPVVLVAIGMCAYVVYAARIALKPAIVDPSHRMGKYLFAILAFFLMLVPVYLLCELILFLATAWDIHWKMHKPLLAALRFPGAAVGGVWSFIQDVWAAFAGPAPAPRPGNRPPVPSESFGSVMLGWAAKFAHEIAVAVVAALLIPVVQRKGEPLRLHDVIRR